MTLKSFPRGGKKPAVKPNFGLVIERISYLKGVRLLGKIQLTSSLKKKHEPIVKRKKNRGKKSREDDSLEEEKNYLADTAECLNYSGLTEGMIVLGRIHETTEYDMIVSLPGRLSGRVQATDVSESYTSLLRDIVNSEDGKIDDFKTLGELYKRGEYVVCCVKSVTPGEKWRLSLSLEPQLINRNLDPARLRKGSKILGTISSVEDHGYVVDTGIDNFRSFLGVKDIDEGIEYHPGKQLFCSVKSVKTSDNVTTAQLTSKSKHVDKATIDDGQYLDAQVPGTRLVLTVQRILTNGLQVSFNNGNVGYVNRIYMDKPLDSYDRGNEIQGILMYVTPTLKFAYFTLLPTDEGKERLSVGETFENAKVSFVGTKGIVLILKRGIRGLVPFRRTDVSYDKISSKFSIGTAHKCRVMAYDLFEQIYVCTMERELLNERHFATLSLKPGEQLDVEIAKIQPETGYLMVTAGRTKGWVPPEHVKDPEITGKTRFKIGDVVKARVLGRDKRQKGVLFTLKKSLVESKLPILDDIADAKIGGKHHGTIVQITSKGLLVRFYDQVKGWIPSRSLDQRTASVRFTIGQVITARVEDVKRESEKLTLSVFNESSNEQRLGEETSFDIGESVEGIVVEASVEGVYLRITRNPEDDPKTGFLPAGHVAPCEEVGGYLAARYATGERISALVFSTSPRFLLTRTFVPREEYRDFHTLRVGNCLPCSIDEITDDGLKLILPVRNFNSYGLATRSNVDNVDSLRLNQILFAKVASIDRKNRKVYLTTSLHGVWKGSPSRDNDLIASIDALTLHLNKLRELSELDYYKTRPISRAKIGERVRAVVDKVTDHGLVLKLDNDVTGTVRRDHYKGKIKPGDMVTGTIFWINFIHEIAEITLLPNLTNAISTRQAKLSNISVETQLRGDIVLVTNWFVLVVLKGAGKGMLAALPTRRHINDIEPDLTPYSIGKRIRCYVVLNKTETDLLPICLIKSSFETNKITETPVKKSLKRKSVDPEDDGGAMKKMKKAKPVEEKATRKKKLNEESTRARETSARVPATPEVEKTTEKRSSRKRKLEEKNAKFKSKLRVSDTPEVDKTKGKNSKREKTKETEITTEEDASVESEQAFSESDESDETKETLGIPECGFFWDNKPEKSLMEAEESSSDDEDDEDETSQTKRKKKKKLSSAERREAERQKEREIREREEALASNEAPKSVDQFDRLVLSSPDSSMIWLQYMAYHLQATEIEKARATAKRAIKTINFREETERLNVWRAWLNLESRFGSPESLNSVFQEAVRTNDARSVYLHMLTVYADAGRQAELEKIVTTIVGKFKQVAEIWIECGAAFLKIGLKDKSRHIMQRALQSLPAQEHVNLMVKFAQMENKYGDKERAQTLFDQVLSSYPKRVDVWSSYVDALVKSENLDTARKVLEKAVVQTLPARKMKTLFKKFIDFEQKHGTPEGVFYVQQLALKYVENECNKEPV